MEPLCCTFFEEFLREKLMIHYRTRPTVTRTGEGQYQFDAVSYNCNLIISITVIFLFMSLLEN